MANLIRQRRTGPGAIRGRMDSLVQGISQQPPHVRLPGQSAGEVNCWPSPVEGLTKRRPTRYQRRLSTEQITDLWGESMLAQSAERYNFALYRSGANCRIDVSQEGQPCSIDVHGTGLSVSGSVITATPASYLFNDSGLSTSYRLVNSGPIALLLNRKKPAAMSSLLSPVIPSDALIFVQAVAFDVGYVVTLNDRVLPEFRTPRATDTVNTLSTATVATQLANRIALEPGFSAVAFGALVFVQKLDGSPYTISIDDSRSNTLARVLKDSVASFSGLPAIAREGFYIKVQSDPSTTNDDYWVKFSANNKSSQFGEGFWQETVAPGIEYKLDENTMPLVIYRAAPRVLFIGPADGAERSITVGPETYTYTFPKWGDRTAGDTTTVPTPSFIGKPIRDHLIFRGRYTLIGGDSIVLSENDNIFNYFQDTSTTVLETDPIDIRTPAESASSPSLNWAIAADESLLLFSDRGQFQVRAADGEVLTPRTAECIRLSNIEMNELIAPRLAGPNVLFATEETGFTGFREYQFINTESRRLGLNLGGSLSITSNVPRLIPGLADVWDVSEGLDFMVVSSPQNRKLLYVYKYLWSTAQNAISKQQSAWGTWQFDGDVQWVRFYDDRLWLIVSYPDGTYLVDMPTPELDDPAAPDIRLDRRLSFPGPNVSATYDPGSNRTTFTLPYQIVSPTDVVIAFGNSRNRGLLIGTGFTGNEIVCSELGDWRTDSVVIGSRYTMSYEFNRAFLPVRNDDRTRLVGEQSGCLRIATWTVHHSNSGPYTIRVKRKNRAEDSRKFFNPRQLNVQSNTLDTFTGELDTGSCRAMVASKNTDCRVFVESDSFFPVTLTGASWEGSYSDRAQAR
jgi:hypothetical protein